MKERECEEAQGLLGQDERQTWRRDPNNLPFMATSLFFLLITNLATFIFTSNYAGPHAHGREEDQSRHCHDLHSDRPLYADIDRDSVHSVNFSAFSLSSSQYTAPPSPEVDKEWEALGVAYHTFIVPVPDGPSLGISDEHVVIPPDAPGMEGKTGYHVDMEAMHQLHCVNLLRKGQYFNYEYYTDPKRVHLRPSWAFADPEPNIRGHINHCIDALRERIMCAADTEILPYYWRDTHGLTITDFAVTRQCRNFESVRQFAEKNQMKDWGTNYRLTTPKDAYIASHILGNDP